MFLPVKLQIGSWLAPRSLRSLFTISSHGERERLPPKQQKGSLGICKAENLGLYDLNKATQSCSRYQSNTVSLLPTSPLCFLSVPYQLLYMMTGICQFKSQTLLSDPGGRASSDIVDGDWLEIDAPLEKYLNGWLSFYKMPPRPPSKCCFLCFSSLFMLREVVHRLQDPHFDVLLIQLLFIERGWFFLHWELKCCNNGFSVGTETSFIDFPI